MKKEEYSEIKHKITRLIAFIKWKGAPIESKQNKIIKELSLINQYCHDCIKLTD